MSLEASPRSGICRGYCLTSFVAVGSPALIRTLGAEIHLASHARSSLVVMPLRSGPTVLPFPIVWQAAHFVAKIVLPSSARAAVVADTWINANTAAARTGASETRPKGIRVDCGFFQQPED